MVMPDQVERKMQPVTRRKSNHKRRAKICSQYDERRKQLERVKYQWQSHKFSTPQITGKPPVSLPLCIDGGCMRGRRLHERRAFHDRPRLIYDMIYVDKESAEHGTRERSARPRNPVQSAACHNRRPEMMLCFHSYRQRVAADRRRIDYTVRSRRLSSHRPAVHLIAVVSPISISSCQPPMSQRARSSIGAKSFCVGPACRFASPATEMLLSFAATSRFMENYLVLSALS